MLLFAVTGITLNNARHIEAEPAVSSSEIVLPPAILSSLQAQPSNDKSPLPDDVADWLLDHLDINAAGKPTEWSGDEVYVSLPRPGGDAWLTIELESGALNHELTDRGWISYLNDLHKGRNTGNAWSWFLDVFSVMAIVFSLTGLCLLYMHSANRPSTWPLVGLGMVIPLVLALLFIH